MALKKFKASSIEAAREKAEKALGHSYIVLETKEPTATEPAWIHVLEDKNLNGNGNGSGTYSRKDLFPKAFNKLKETVNDSLQLFNPEQRHSDRRSKRQSDRNSSQQGNRQSSQQSDRSTKQQSLSDTSGRTADEELQARAKENANRSGIGEDTKFSLDMGEAPNYEKDFQALNQKIDRLEKLVADQVIGGNIHFISHPAFQQLLANGVPYATITAWFNGLINQGAEPYGKSDQFLSLLGAKVKESLDIAATKKPAHLMLFTGMPGSGKSSLIMKLALHPALLGNASCALVSVVPAKQKNYYSSLAAFATEHEINHSTIRTLEELKNFAASWPDFDHVFVEMPSQQTKYRSSLIPLKHFYEFNAKVKALEVHQVVNSTSNSECLNKLPLFQNPSAPTYLDFTHLDSAPQKGHLLPLMRKSGCKARYTSSGPTVPDDISKFEPASFARQLFSNA
jgi:flagellar biosynthesis GTPase FlhF